jgi:hypothetical protein
MTLSAQPLGRDDSVSEEGGSSESPSRRNSFTQIPGLTAPAAPTHTQHSTLDDSEFASELGTATDTVASSLM